MHIPTDCPILTCNEFHPRQIPGKSVSISAVLIFHTFPEAGSASKKCANCPHHDISCFSSLSGGVIKLYATEALRQIGK
jgi:hypothetical protein